MPTRHALALRADHAAARDAVHRPLDVPALLEGLRELTGRDAVKVRSLAPTRSDYLRRPDWGRTLHQDDKARLSDLRSGELAPRTPDLSVVLGDGLSPLAIDTHGVGIVAALLQALTSDLVLAPVVVATQARVALGDEVGALLGARAVLVLIGERPGLSSNDSVGAYLTWAPRPGRADSERNCISNIRAPHGLSYEAAAHTITGLLAGAEALGGTGVALKDVTPAYPGVNHRRDIVGGDAFVDRPRAAN